MAFEILFAISEGVGVRVFGALTEFGSHGPVGIYQRPNTAKTVRPRYLPARPPQGAQTHTRSQVCVRYKTRSRHTHLRTCTYSDTISRE